MIENNSLNDRDEMTYFNCLGTGSAIVFNRLSPGLYEQYPEVARSISSSLLGRYKIEELLDQNQFGFTYLASTLEGKRFVIKEFFPQKYAKRTPEGEMLIKLPSNANELTQFNYLKNFFMGEVSNLKKISNAPHPNLLDVNTIIQNKGNAMYSICTYEEGMTLDTYLKNKKEDFEIYDILNPLLDAIEHLHTLGIYHLDIKPENILIRKDGSVLLMGFEASSFFYDTYDKYYCNAYTPRYAAPEQVSVEHSTSLNESTDIYAIGVLLHYMITGTYPPKASERIEFGKAEDPYIPLEEQIRLDKYDITLLHVVDKALKFSNKDRFKNIERVKNTLNPVVTNNKKKMYGIAGILATALLVLLGWSLFDTKEEVIKDSPTIIVTKDKQEDVNKTLSHEIRDEKKNTIVNVVSSADKQEENVEVRQGIDIAVNVMLSEDIGKNKILVNNKVLTDGHFTAYKDESYQIDILNPYYYPLHEERTFIALKEYPKQMFVPMLGKAKLYLKGLPEETGITINYKSRDVVGATPITFNNGTYEVILPAGKKFDVTLYKKGYKDFTTELFVLEHGKALTKRYELKKKELVQKKEILPDVTKTEPVQTLNIIKPTLKKKPKKKQKEAKVKVFKKTEPVKILKARTRKLDKASKKKKLRKRKVKINKKKNLQVKQKKRVKKITTKKKKRVQVRKKPSVKNTSGFVWSCSAIANGINKVRVKHVNRKVSEQRVMRQCRKKVANRSRCRILNCFLVR